MSSNRPPLALNDLDSVCLESFHSAMGHALSRRHSQLEIEHWLHCLIQEPYGGWNTVFEGYGISRDSVIESLEKKIQSLESHKSSSVRISPSLSKILLDAVTVAKGAKKPQVDPLSVLVALIQDASIWDRLRYDCPQLHAIPLDLEAISDLALTLDFAEDLTEKASEGKLDSIVGREKELEQVIETLLRRGKNNPVLVGAAGVGKTAIVELLAQKIERGEVPEKLKNKKVLSLDLGLLVAGASARGEFEHRLKSLVSEVKKTGSILFIDEMHLLTGSGRGEGAMDAANLLKPALARGEFCCIGATTPDEYRQHIEKDTALERRFQPVFVGEPNRTETLAILNECATALEAHHGVKYNCKALASAYMLSRKYLPNRNLPDKALDILDTAGARALQRGLQEVGDSEVTEVLESWTGIPILDSSSLLERVEESLERRLLGQARARRDLTRFLRSEGKAALLVGPPSTGKTFACELISRELFGDENRVLSFDMRLFSEKSRFSQLIGPPPGYAEHSVGGLLTNPIRQRPFSVVVFENFEAACQDFFMLLSQILGEKKILDSRGRIVSFENTKIFLTSTVSEGSSILECLERGVKTLPREKIIPVIFEALDFETLENILIAKLEASIEESKFSYTDEAIELLVQKSRNYHNPIGALEEYVHEHIVPRVLKIIKKDEIALIDADEFGRITVTEDI